MSKIESLEVVVVQQDALDCQTLEEVSLNLEATLKWIDKACRAYPETDLIVFPECGIQGGHPDPNPQIAFPMDSPYIASLLEKCREKEVWAVFNILESNEGRVYNTSLLVDDKGEIAIKYRKVNTFAPLERNYPGDKLMVCPGPKGAVFGLMTCYDGDFPEVGRELALLGANVFLRPTSYMEPHSTQWEFTNRARAYENLAYVVACNRTGNSELFTWFGASEVVDYDGKVIAKMPASGEWMTKVTIYPELASQARRERKECNHLYNLFHRGNGPENPTGLVQNPYTKTQEMWANKQKLS